MTVFLSFPVRAIPGKRPVKLLYTFLRICQAVRGRGGKSKVKKVFGQAFFKRLAGVSGAEPTSRDRSRAPENAKKTQEGEPEISPVDCFGPGEPSSGVSPARRLRRLARGKGCGENLDGVFPTRRGVNLPPSSPSQRVSAPLSRRRPKAARAAPSP